MFEKQFDNIAFSLCCSLMNGREIVLHWVGEEHEEHEKHVSAATGGQRGIGNENHFKVVLT
jgi:hypothetical protein